MKKLTLLTLFFSFISVCSSYGFSNIVEDKNEVLNKFLMSLDENQKTEIFVAIDGDKRTDWTYLPTYMVPREGVNFKTLSANQKLLFHNVLKSFMSEAGYEKAKNVFGLESVLKSYEGAGSKRDPDNYYITFYGNPMEDEVWAWGFEGHHLSLNYTVVGDKMTISPRFFGSNPAEVPRGPRKGFRLLKMEEDIAFDLMASMSPAQQKKAIFSETTFSDIRSARNIVVEPFKNEGIKYKELNEKQQKLIDLLIDLYLDPMPAKDKAARMEKIESEESKDELVFAWAGSTTQLHVAHYYMIQGKTFLIEFDNTQNNANHVHSVWRDFNGDFGRDLIKEHYAKSH